MLISASLSGEWILSNFTSAESLKLFTLVSLPSGENSVPLPSGEEHNTDDFLWSVMYLKSIFIDLILKMNFHLSHWDPRCSVDEYVHCSGPSCSRRKTLRGKECKTTVLKFSNRFIIKNKEKSLILL